MDKRKNNKGSGRKALAPKKAIIDLSTLQKARKSFANIVIMYDNGELIENRARCLSYLMSGLLAYYRLEKEFDIEKRLAAIEQALKENAENRGLKAI